MGDMRSGAASAGSSNKWAILAHRSHHDVHGDARFEHRQRGVAGHAKGVGADSTKSSGSRRVPADHVRLLLVFGRRLGDLYGKVRYFEIGVVIFPSAPLCGMSTSLPALVASRAVQGVGGASAMANNMGIITEAFPRP
ncbi:MAG: MFS transporter [Collinsella aerofaciens]